MEIFVGSVLFPIFDYTQSYESQFHIFFFLLNYFIIEGFGVI